MHRQPLRDLLVRHLRRWPDDHPHAERIRRLVEDRSDCLLRSCAPGHITASCWIVSHDHARFLLTHHAKLKRWLQLGGHVDGESDVQQAALREAREESGIEQLEFFQEDGQPISVDVDVHTIPARPGEPEHEHHDIRFLLIAPPDARLIISDESLDLRWFPRSELEKMAGDGSVLRLAQKAHALLGL